jgi:hypothetical protein
MRKNRYGNICSILVEMQLYCTILKRLFLHFQYKGYGCSIFPVGEKVAKNKNPEKAAEVMLQLHSFQRYYYNSLYASQMFEKVTKFDISGYTMKEEETAAYYCFQIVDVNNV